MELEVRELNLVLGRHFVSLKKVIVVTVTSIPCSDKSERVLYQIYVIIVNKTFTIVFIDLNSFFLRTNLLHLIITPMFSSESMKYRSTDVDRGVLLPTVSSRSRR